MVGKYDLSERQEKGVDLTLRDLVWSDGPPVTSEECQFRRSSSGALSRFDAISCEFIAILEGAVDSRHSR